MKKKELEKAYEILKERQVELIKELALQQDYVWRIRKKLEYWKNGCYIEAKKREEFRRIARISNKRAYELSEENKRLKRGLNE